MRKPPHYFSEIFEQTSKRWNQLEGDPELAAPWKQLFDQVQSPRHVVSELLQNADDVGASEVSTGIENEQFYFQHNGKDFNKDEFSSLCRFGYSNKRKLHTIGFRGIGFKSTFSIGEPVQVFSPTLAVEFYKKRFTLPNWINNAEFNSQTKVSVPVNDKYSKSELSKNLKEWTLNPVSLLFFKSIQKLTIGSIQLQKRIIGKGPTLNSEKINLIGNDTITELKLFTSQEEQFPKDAIDEMRRDRNLDGNFELPYCNVEVLIGLPQAQRIYVVLPTGVLLKTPFSCNAPFIQDPARVGIKSPSTSPTNRWLLKRIGKLAAEAMLDWLNNKSLSIEQRAEAYCLLPKKTFISDSLESDVNEAICKGFNETIQNRPFLLTTTGDLVKKQDCIAPPLDLYEIWTAEQILQVFGKSENILSGNIDKEYREKLKSWQYIDDISVDNVIERLKSSKSIPKPNEFYNLLKLWSFAKTNLENDYWGDQRKKLHIIPVKSSEILFSCNNVVRIPAKREFINEESWNFLIGLVDIIDPEWIRYITSIEKRIEKGEDIGKPALQLFRDLGLNNPSDSSTIIRNAAHTYFSRKEKYISDCVKLAHLAAALDARIDAEFRYVTRDKQLRSISDELVATNDSSTEELLPEDWIRTHLLHDDYYKDFEACTKQVWNDWVKTEKSGLWPFAPLKKAKKHIWSRNDLVQALRNRNVNPPSSYQYVTCQFYFNDFNFEDEIINHWKKQFLNDTGIWAKIVSHILNASTWYWQKNIEANVTQIATTGTEGRIYTSAIPANWIILFKELPCLFDTYGKSRNPVELYIRNPDTEPFIGVEPFVKAELDTESTKPLLLLLGVREKPADVGKIVDRIRALSRVPDPTRILSEIINWYKALDRALVSSPQGIIEEIKEEFLSGPLILTSENKWAKSSEVFVYSSEDYPEAFTIHTAVNNLTIWIRIGVASYPTSDLIIEWISNLPSDEILDQDTLKRVRVALQRYPTQLWENCNHWLALDNAWRPVSSFRYRMTMQSLTKFADLFQNIKSRCANFQMLNKELCDNVPFAHLPDLESKIEYRLTREPSRFLDNSQKPNWLRILGKTFKRIKFNDENLKENLYKTADRMENSVWLTFHKSDSLQVTPYIDNTPAGMPQDRRVLWYDKHIFIKDGDFARSFEEIVSELARPFEDSKIKAAINACIARDDSFILDYLNENFDLEDEKLLTKHSFLRDKEDGDKDNPVNEFEEDEISIDSKNSKVETITETTDIGEPEIDDPELPEPESKQSQRKGADLFERYVTALGYKWDVSKNRYYNHDGSWIEKSFHPFHWKLKAKNGSDIDYWVSSQCLQRTSIEITYELWNFIEQYPQTSSLILIDEAGNPIEYKGRKIMNWKQTKKIAFATAKYRIWLVE